MKGAAGPPERNPPDGDRHMGPPNGGKSGAPGGGPGGSGFGMGPTGGFVGEQYGKAVPTSHGVGR